MKFKNKANETIEVDALRWTINISDMMDFLKGSHYESSFEDSRLKLYPQLTGSMGVHIAEIGDYVIKNGNGSFIPMTAERFEREFEVIL
jgi:hypothetical protein